MNTRPTPWGNTPYPPARTKRSTLRDLIWRWRAAARFQQRLDMGWKAAWYFAGAVLETAKADAADTGHPIEAPRDAVDEELSCWSD